VFKPGCKFEYVLTLVGEEGKQKSSLFDVLGGQWFSDTFLGVEGKEAYEQLQGVWIMEIPELAGFRRSESEEVKKYIGKRKDQYRPPYQRRPVINYRQVIFVGTTNDRDFLTSQNGNRRFWPVDIWVNAPFKNVFDDLTAAERDQIWAEAYHYYEADEMLFLSADMEEEAKMVQSNHTEKDERADTIRAYLEMEVPVNWKDKSSNERYIYINSDPSMREKGHGKQDTISVMGIWCELFGREPSQLTRLISKDLHNIMRNMPGWEYANTKTQYKLYGTQRYYKRVK
jgi:predicted P-loop ATPase